MKKMLSILILPLFFVTSVTSMVAASQFKPEAVIASVVVYPDRALVTRTAELTLTEGEHVVMFANLPANIDINSIRAKGEGDAGVRIFSIESRRVVLEQPREEQIKKLEAEIEGVRDDIASADTRLANLKAEGELVRSIGVYAGQQFSKEFITRQPRPEEWNAMVEFQRNNMARISEQIRQTEIQKRDLNRTLDALLRKLEELRGQSARESQEVRLALSAAAPGNFKLFLSCVIYGAGWYPSYDARANTKEGKVEFIYLGNVRQNTGEDWRDVEVSLSTAQPAVGAKMPEIQPWRLRPQPPIVYETEALEGKIMLRGMETAPSIAAPAEMALAQVVQLGASVQFKIPRKMDIPSDNAFHRAAILSENLPAKLSYTSTPRLSPYAYLTAKVTNATGAQWLAGNVSVFVNGDYIGTSSIKPVAPNEESDLDMGIDEGIKVKREELVRKEDETRILGKKKERRFKDKLTVENHKTTPIELLLVDQIPVSEHEDIVVSDIKFSEKPGERDADKGIVKWRLSLAPGAKKEIVVEFVVAHPLDMIIEGL
ncbi:MAG: mucoidy inhibitor MuiA family protein [Candidatus Lindowbacteria bacterium]|nr:mucoidy inhibitor MuiA family protein [Candidatus Lindowbacteria bacterium]